MASSADGQAANVLSRAVKIPHREGSKAYPPATARQRRSARHHAVAHLSDPSDAGTSSLSSENSSPASSLLHPSLLTHSKSTATSRMPFDDRSREDDYSRFSPGSSPSSSEGSYPAMHAAKQKAKAVHDLDPPNTMSSLVPARSSPLGPSMLSSQTYKSINLNGLDPDEPPRLLTFTKAGQGFNWNEELFLPSYLVSRYSRSRRKQYDGDLGEDDVEVAEIFVTDEEANKMMP